MVYPSSRESAVQFLLKVDPQNLSVTIGSKSYGVTYDVAWFFFMLREAGGEWVSGTSMKQRMQAQGVTNYRADRVCRDLEEPLKRVVDSGTFGYRFLPSAVEW